MRIDQAFCTPLVYHKNEDIVDGLKKYILDNQPQGVDSNVGADIKHNLKESRFDFFNSNESIIQESIRWFGNCLVETVTHFDNYYREKHLVLNGKYGVGFVDSWFHIGKKYSVHEVHNHGNCSWCGIFYVDVGDVGSGETVFRNPITSTFTDCGNSYMFTSMKVIPENGKLVLFPSYLDHYQSLYTGDKDRIVIGFNMTLVPG